MAITIKDVAREAGVSFSTVSKVIHGSPAIPKATSDKVNAVMERLEYIPNQRAANFARASTKNVAFLTTLDKGRVYEDPHKFEIICGAREELQKNGYTLTLIDISREENEREIIRKIILGKSSDGIIVHGINRNTADFIVSKGFPHIAIGKPDSMQGISWIDVDNVFSGEIAAQHLFQFGYNRIAYIGGKEEDLASSFRLHGAQSFLQGYKMEIDVQYIRFINSDVKESYNAMVSLLAKPNLPDAVICANNLIAVGVSRALEDKKVAVPEDIGVVMIDDNPYSKVFTLLPTVVILDLFDLGVQTAKVLLRKIKDPALKVQIYSTLPVLIQRETTQQR